MSTPVRRAMVLAAGFGSRLGELGLSRPKPLLPVCDRPLLAWTLRWLRCMGIEEVMINTHHLAEQIVQAVGDGSDFGVRVSYSHEEEILGTGGGIRRVESWLDDRSGAPILVLNGKLLHDIDLAAVYGFHRETAAEATMVVRRDLEGIWGASLRLRNDGTFAQFLGEPAAAATEGDAVMFCGVHLFEPRFLQRIPRDELAPCIVRTAYRGLFEESVGQAAAEGGLRGYVHQGYWWEHSTPERYLQGVQRVLREQVGLSRVAGPVASKHPSAIVEPSAHVDPRTSLAAGVIVRAGATIGPGVDLGSNVEVDAGAHLESCVVWPGLRIRGSYRNTVVYSADSVGASLR